VFLLLALATLALAVVLLQDEKERSYASTSRAFARPQAEVMARLRHPAGLLALLNPTVAGDVTPLRPLMLRTRRSTSTTRTRRSRRWRWRAASVRYPDGSSLCAAIGNNPYAGGFIYLVGSFRAGDLVPRAPGALDLEAVHRARIRLEMRGELQGLGGSLSSSCRCAASRWCAAGSPASASAERPRVGGRLRSPVRDFGAGLAKAPPAAPGGEPARCPRRVFFSSACQWKPFARRLLASAPAWHARATWTASACTVRCWLRQAVPPLVRQQLRAAVAPASLRTCAQVLQPGEVLTIRGRTRRAAAAGARRAATTRGPQLAADPAPDRPPAGGRAARRRCRRARPSATPPAASRCA
jgi:hypothetical protein